tara:strand:+ start:61 stop:1374 length:1314 start_codon:yes stop_codon:yes gene_type:complete
MANNVLIEGAKVTGKKFLDVGKAVAQGFAASSAAGASNRAEQKASQKASQKDRASKNQKIQNRVNSFMNNLKTDMDFTSFSPEETKTIRNALVSSRTRYANAAMQASRLDDTTSPEYMGYVDIMQEENNTFKNMASQLDAYKKGKVDYATNQLEGLYSDGNGEANANAAKIYGFADIDEDGVADKGVSAPFKILARGNLGFDLDGQEVTYNNMPQPFLKDTQFLNTLNAKVESAYNAGIGGKNNNPYAIKSYKQELETSLQNEDRLKSIIFDFPAEADLKDIGVALDNNEIDLPTARQKVIDNLVKAREDAYTQGKKQYDVKQNKTKPTNGNPVSYFETTPIKKEIELINNRFDGEFDFKEQGTQNFQLRRQGKYGDTKTREYYYNQNADGIIFISPNKDMVESENVAKSNTFNPAIDADVKRAKEEFGIDIIPTFE